jgi:uncharacterized membrane protein
MITTNRTAEVNNYFLSVYTYGNITNKITPYFLQLNLTRFFAEACLYKILQKLISAEKSRGYGR